jgi:hypothetical protein
LEAFLARLVPPLQEASAAFERLLRDFERVSIAA